MQNKKVKIRIKRYDPDTEITKFESYDIPLVKGMTILEGLWYIVDHVDGSLSFRYSCRGAVCGSCAMKINGKIDLACHLQISDFMPQVITLEPLSDFPLIKDLVVDMEPFLINTNQ